MTSDVYHQIQCSEGISEEVLGPSAKAETSNDMVYIFTTTAFIKISRLPFSDPYEGNPEFIWRRSWNHERITNEAKALRLVAQKTTIPVPKILLTEHYQMTDDDVLPQLDKLRSQDRVLDGFVMPPSWLAPDAQSPWKGKKNWKTLSLHESQYVLQHGDLAAHNLIMDPQTLRVRALIDWEYPGYFPPGMERWPGSLSKDAYRGRRRNLAQAIAQYLPDDYLECYENWANKDELRKLIESGDHPDPTKLHTTVLGIDHFRITLEQIDPVPTSIMLNDRQAKSQRNPKPQTYCYSERFGQKS
ncbi:hypothetical protein T440DRAFT_512143 [Plenodomus tracheiphilus IPT5]|uniref:Aminoglycoside phosphotransferase domain-containing protein n=1 Tax=Plenodomus tracheiphilus IPT5 TaxID=1408161 RepID=A0A6A7AMU9_9PLEO|nr:hypothetical protein T440DRAFT_512143 [Plenodomus tracheiphilus IPT5]